MNVFDLEKLNRKYEYKSPKEIIQFMINKLGRGKIVLASSLSIEDQVLTKAILDIDKKARIFFLDTGRHYQETYDLLALTMDKYDFKYEVYTPQNRELQELVSNYGPNLFYKSTGLRKKCCYVRKIEPLKRVLSKADGWICGLRKEQSAARNGIDIFEWDEIYGIYKINPLAYWKEEDVWKYIHKENIPYNKLYDSGFTSIGCQPCTRAVTNGEDVRSGRWWWESHENKECGLHRA